jgi:predicted phage terminase large subunit-like protein
MLLALQDAITKPNGRLMMFLPPGAAKSTYASVVATAWAMGRRPGLELGLISYASEIATKHSRRVRSMARDPAYQSLWDERPTLSNEKGAADNWQMTNGSSMLASGILAGITGNRFGGAVIDDPVRNREEADSTTVQQKVYDEYNDTILTRLIPGAWLVLVQTRWSELDLSSRILPEDYDGQSGPVLCQDGQVWDVLCIPAKADRQDDPLGRQVDEYLWTDWFKPGHWDKWEKNPTAQRTWSALCQQRPAPKEGIQFSRSDFRWYDPDKPADDRGEDTLPAHLFRYGASDYATKSGDGDFTAHGVFGMDFKGNLYALDWYSKQVETDKSIEAFINLIRAHKPRRWANEGGVIDHAIGPAIRRAMRETNQYVLVESIPSIQDKGSKLLSFHARAKAGTVYFPKNRQWAQDVVDQLVKFPAVKHDDSCDVCGLLGRMVDKMSEAAVPSPPKRETIVPFTGRWIESSDHESKREPRYTS